MSTLKLYKGTPLLPDKNFCVDDLSTYLATYAGTNLITINDFQYIKHGLSISIKINKGQAFLEFSKAANDFNYISIQNTEDTYPVYYFIISKRWIAKDTCQLVLKMDTLNTFTLARSSFAISPRTLVDREMKDRYGFIGTYTDADDYIDEYIIFDHDIIRDYQGEANLAYNRKTITLRWFDVNAKKFTQEKVIEDVENLIVQNQIIRVYVHAPFLPVLEYTLDYTEVPEDVIVVFSCNSTYLTFTCVDVSDNILKYYPYQLTLTLRRVIDRVSEGLSPVLFRNGETTIQDITNFRQSWYLVYKNRDDIVASDFNQVNPVQCFLVGDNNIDIGYSGGSETISVGSLQDGKIYYIRKPTWDASAVTPNDVSVEDENGNSESTTISNAIRQMIYFYKSGNDIVWGYVQGWDNNSWYAHYVEIGKTKFLIPDTNPCLVGVSSSLLDEVTKTNYEAITTESYMTLASSSVQIDGIDDVDRTSAKMIKIIKLPYCPLEMSYSGGIFQFDRTKFEYDSTDEIDGIMLKDLNISFSRSITSNVDSPYSVYDNLDPTEVDVNSPYQAKFESKLYHSDYYKPKFIYDSFATIFKLEFAKFDSGFESKLSFIFKMTSTINSKFLFQFVNYTDIQEEDYPFTLPVARNNEMTLYNSQYLNYLRTGYNYDVKAKTRTEVGSWLGTTLSAIGAIASFASSSVTGAAGIAAGVGLATATTSQFANSIIQTANAEANFEAKQTQLKNQAANVAGSDDVDLMSYYTGNRAKFMIYKLSPRMEKAMLDVFHYTGYTSGERKVPTMTGRVWFNFVKCDIIFTSEENIPSECVDDLKECFANGVYFMHKYNNTYNWGLDHENWETLVIDYLS
ncbi:hypothetical protein J6W34_00315 [bacterium]|nr:hypothetical protein [bacterium]